MLGHFTTLDMKELKTKMRSTIHNNRLNHLIVLHVYQDEIDIIFWSVFSYILTEYGDLRSKFPYSIRMQGNTDQEKLRIWTLFTQWLIFAR